MTDKQPPLAKGIRPGIRRLLGLDVVRKDRIAAELEDELQMHLELRAEQMRKLGMSEEMAMQQARARYGAIDQATSEIRQHAARTEQAMQRRITLDSLMQDTRFAFRTLARSKSWTVIAVLTLALGIGANTAVFSIVNDLLLDPLKYPNANRLVLISRSNERSHLQTVPTMDQVHAFRSARSLENLEGIGSSKKTLDANGDPVSAHVGLVSSTFARFTGARVLLGRFVLPTDERPDATPIVILSNHIWQSRFGGTRDVIGKMLKIEGKQFTVVGVLNDGVRIPSYNHDPVDVWTPISANDQLGGAAVARLANGATLESAREELNVLARNADGVDVAAKDVPFDIVVTEPGSQAQTRTSIFMIAGAVCLLLLIACANVAHLLLARGAIRERELSIRAALGAGRGRIVRQLVTESLILSMAGCVVGIVVGQLSLRAIVALRPENLSELANVQIDAHVLMATAALSVISGIAFGLVAAFSGKNGRSFETLRSSTGTTADRSRNRLRSMLVITENALSVVLLIGAVLLIRTVTNLYQIDPGFDATNVYAMSYDLPTGRYDSKEARQSYADRLVTEARRIPGVDEATIAAWAPSRTGIMIGNWVGEGGKTVKAEAAPTLTATNVVSADYFKILRMRLVSGHAFDDNIVRNHEVIISRSMARQIWSDTNVVGRRLRMAGQSKAHPDSIVWNVVAGVAADAALLSLTDKGTTPGIYYPMSKSPDRHQTLIVRINGAIPTAAFRRLFLSIDPSMSPPEISSVTSLLQRSVTTQRFLMALLTIFAMLAVTLSAIGLYGVITYMVSQSTREIGVRVALGAARSDVIRLVMQKGVVLSVIGLAIGLIASLWGARLLDHTLYGVSRTDPLSYLIGASLLLLIAIAACIAPTARAVRIDPMLAMRSE